MQRGGSSKLRRGPLLRFPILIMALIAVGVMLLAMYAFTLTSTIASPSPPIRSMALPLPSDPTKPPPATTVSEHTVLAHPRPTTPPWTSPPRPFHPLWPRTAQGAYHRPKDPPDPLAYDPDPTPDPRGLPLQRHPSRATTSPSGRILTRDRREKRIAPLIPAVRSADFPEHPGERDREWNIVIGIPSIDTPSGTQRRKYQRASWLRYDNIWKGANPSASVLVKYLLAYHPLHNYTLSSSLLDEAKKHKDVILFDMKEGVPSTSSKKKSWAVEVGMSRKAYAWYCFVADTYRANFVIKGDDDEFMRTKYLEAVLNSLPFASHVYYGRVMYWGVKKGSSQKFPFSGGMSITMSYDLIDWIRDSRYVEKGVDYFHEDVMVGRWFYFANVPLNVTRDCRHHDVHRGANRQKLTSRSMCIHHLKDEEKEYTALFDRFPDTPPPRPEKHRAVGKDSMGNNYLDAGGVCEK